MNYKPVTKVIIPAAGLGTRLLPATKAVAKEMMPILDKPALQFAVEEAVTAGIEEVIIITNNDKPEIKNHFTSNLALEKILLQKNKMNLLQEVRKINHFGKITFINQNQPQGLGDAILQAGDYIGNQPFAIILSDDIVFNNKPNNSPLKECLAAFNKHQCSILGVQKVAPQDACKYGIVEAKKEISPGLFAVQNLIEKPTPQESNSTLAILGRYVLTPALFQALKKTKPGKGNEIQLTDGIMKILQKEEIYAKIFNGTRYDVGSKKGFLQATISYAKIKKI